MFCCNWFSKSCQSVYVISCRLLLIGSTDGRIRVENLKPDTNYTLSVRAKNEVGVGQPIHLTVATAKISACPHWFACVNSSALRLRKVCGQELEVAIFRQTATNFQQRRGCLKIQFCFRSLPKWDFYSVKFGTFGRKVFYKSKFRAHNPIPVSAKTPLTVF